MDEMICEYLYDRPWLDYASAQVREIEEVLDAECETEDRTGMESYA